MDLIEHAIRDVLVTPEHPYSVVEHLKLKGFNEVEAKVKLRKMLYKGILDHNRYGELEVY